MKREPNNMYKACLLTQVESLLRVVESLSAMLGEQVPAGEAELMTHVKQISLFALRLLCKMLAAAHPQRFMQVSAHAQ